MNVIISNQLDNITDNLNIEVIESLKGEFDADELAKKFENLFFARMILDVTSLKDYTDVLAYKKLSMVLPVDKIILLLPSQSIVSDNSFLSKLISMGYYNFTTNVEGLKYLLEHPNSYRDVANIHQIDESTVVNNVVHSNVLNRKISVGIKNITDSAGATTLTYLLYKELIDRGIDAIAIEVDKRDFVYFNDKSLISISKDELATTLLKNQKCDVILVDLNGADGDICTETLYLVEPSLIKMGKLNLKNRTIFSTLVDKKIVLNKCLLDHGDIKQFESEAGTKLFYVMPPIDDRKRQNSISELLSKLNII